MRLAAVLCLVCSLQPAKRSTASIAHPVRRRMRTFCERNLIVCIGGGALVMGGVAFAPAGHKSGSMGGGY